MNKDLIYLFAIIATAAVAIGVILTSGALTTLGAALFFLPIIIGIAGDSFKKKKKKYK